MMKREKEAVVILPVYRPDHTLTELTEQLWEYGIQPLVVDDGSEPEYRHFLKKSAISVWCCGIGKIWEKEPLSRRLLDIFRENCGIPM